MLLKQEAQDSPSRRSLRSVWMKHLDRRGGLWRGAEGDETEAGVVDFLILIPPPRQARFASLICLGTPPVQVFHPDRAKRASGRGVFDVGSLHFNILIFNELQRRHYKRSEGTPCHPQLRGNSKKKENP